MKPVQMALAAIAAVVISCVFAAGQSSPRQSNSSSLQLQQLKFPRVRAAKQEKDAVLRSMVDGKGLTYPPRAILLRAFKKEGALELWGASSEAGPYVLLKTYGICATSGVLGPKRRNGDLQVPEGFYDLDFFNPQSNFFLSLHINYPNAADSILGYRPNLGGTIYLHGNCASIGCIPITDDGIKEVYWLSVLVRDSGAKHLPLQIFPARMSESGFRELAKTRSGEPELIAFWANLKGGFDAFEKGHKLAAVRVAKDGRYEFLGE